MRLVSPLTSQPGGLDEREGGWLLSYASIAPVVCVLDGFLITISSITTGLTYNTVIGGSESDFSRYLVTAFVMGILVVAAMRERNLYDPTALVDWRLQSRTIVRIWFAAFLVFCGAVFAFKIGKDFSRGAVLSFGAAGLLGLLCHHALWRWAIESALREGSLRRRSSILLRLGRISSDRRVLSDLRACGFAIEKDISCGDGASLSTVEEIIAAARGSNIEEIFLVADLARWIEVDRLVQQLCVLPIQVTIIPDGGSAALFQSPVRRYGATIGVEFQRPPLSTVERFWKRLLDLLCATIGLVLFIPMFTVIALAVKLDSPGPVLFLQARQGFNGRQFKILKFRTMTVLEDGSSITQVRRFDKRVTRVGSWLRRTSIDELPQLFNVLIGDMSIVGPRPHATAHDNYYAELISQYALRQHVKPGITGWAQVNGWRGETSTVDLMRARVELDTWYVGNWSLWLDLLIIFRTVVEVVRARNAH
jgi:putative colanic acid biosynthesis UDP-glucose lipid carrier transferase